VTPFEIAGVLVSCLDAAYEDDAGKPAEICHRPGSEVRLDFGTTEDECCAGLGWVRITEIAQVVDPDEAQNAGYNPCDTTGRRLTLELGVARCQPFGTAAKGPSCEDWTTLAARIDTDAARMRQAVCCTDDALVTDNSTVYRILPGTWTPLDSSGGCTGGTLTVTVWLDCEDC